MKRNDKEEIITKTKQKFLFKIMKLLSIGPGWVSQEVHANIICMHKIYWRDSESASATAGREGLGKERIELQGSHSRDCGGRGAWR
jgi:hypothetical protein